MLLLLTLSCRLTRKQAGSRRQYKGLEIGTGKKFYRWLMTPGGIGVDSVGATSNYRRRSGNECTDVVATLLPCKSRVKVGPLAAMSLAVWTLQTAHESRKVRPLRR